jgi:hypothetical protein
MFIIYTFMLTFGNLGRIMLLSLFTTTLFTTTLSLKILAVFTLFIPTLSIICTNINFFLFYEFLPMKEASEGPYQMLNIK